MDIPDLGYAPAGVFIGFVVESVKRFGLLSGMWLFALCVSLSVIFGVAFENYKDSAPSWGAVFRGVINGGFLAMAVSKTVDLAKEYKALKAQATE